MNSRISVDHPKIAPPDKASATLTEYLGYPIGPKLLRTLAKNGRVPSVWTGRCLLINIEKTIEYFENGDQTEEAAPAGKVRHVFA